MSSGNYFSLSFPELIGLIVTILSVTLVIKQLNDTRLATQLAGFLAISDQFVSIAAEIEFIDSLRVSDGWNDLDGQSAYQYLNGDDKRRETYKKVAAFYEVMAALFRRGALDKKLAVDTFGGLARKRWLTLQKAVIAHRKIIDEETLYDQWEWMANNLPI
jgi:hypothetical protein